MMRKILRPFWIALALLFLFEAWLWERLKPVVAWIVGLLPLARIKAQLVAWIDALPPAATLVVFVVPAVLLFPIKLAGLWLLGHGYWLGALTVLGLAKLVGLGVTAFVFDATKPKLLQLAWFRHLYELVLRGLAWAHGLVDPVKAQVKAWIKEHTEPLRRRLRRLVWLMRGRRGGRFVRRVMRLRRRMRMQTAA